MMYWSRPISFPPVFTPVNKCSSVGLHAAGVSRFFRVRNIRRAAGFHSLLLTKNSLLVLGLRIPASRHLHVRMREGIDLNDLIY
jgi:hypothetical protein